MMTFDHLLITPFNGFKKLYLHSYGPLGFFSAAEMFFFISGLVIGFILVTKPEFSIWKRIKKIYLANWITLLVLSSLFCLFPRFFAEWNQPNELMPFLEKPLESVFSSALFLYLPYYFDVLPIYCLFFLIVPIIAKLLREHRIITLLIVSFSLWCFGQLAPSISFEQLIDPFLSHQKLPWFDPFGWQILFVVGAASGYLYKKNPQNIIFNPSHLVLCAIGIFLFSCFVLRHYFAGDTFFLSPLIDIKTLGPLRAINFFLAMYFGFGICKNKTWFQIPALAYLGQYSLTVFLYHAVLIYLLDSQRVLITSLDLLYQMVIFAAAILSLWAAAFCSERFSSANIGRLNILKVDKTFFQTF